MVKLSLFDFLGGFFALLFLLAAGSFSRRLKLGLVTFFLFSAFLAFWAPLLAFDNEPDGPDFEEQIRILISSIEDKKDMDQIYRYWQSEKKKRDYSEETFLDNLITNNIYSYSDSDINI